MKKQLSEYSIFLENYLRENNFKLEDLTNFDLKYIRWWEFENNKERFKTIIKNEWLNDSAVKTIMSYEDLTGRTHCESELIVLNQLFSTESLLSESQAKDALLKEVCELMDDFDLLKDDWDKMKLFLNKPEIKKLMECEK